MISVTATTQALRKNKIRQAARIFGATWLAPKKGAASTDDGPFKRATGGVMTPVANNYQKCTAGFFLWRNCSYPPISPVLHMLEPPNGTMIPSPDMSIIAAG